MGDRPDNYGHPWTREELIVAFDLYCRIPFQQTKAGNPDVQSVARILRRSSAGVARKLGNFGAFDPGLRKKNISGLIHGSRLDKEVWEDFHDDWAGLVLEAAKLRSEFARSAQEPDASAELLVPPDGPSERITTAKQRIHQAFFRSAILSSYQGRCCITGISLREALVACHIVPWSVSEDHRADPTNGLCLSATFDRLFDAGLITIDHRFRVQFSPRAKNAADLPTRTQLLCFEGQEIVLPERFAPSQNRLAWHREHVFAS